LPHDPFPWPFPIDDAVAAAIAADRSEPMTVMGSFEALAGPADVARFVVEGQVLDTNRFRGERHPSEQVALGLWRVARLRGGPFWSAFAGWVADWVEARAPGTPHDLLGRGEVHARMAADAVLLLAAAGRADAAARHLVALEAMSVPCRGGRWYLHDSAEAGDHDAVLNTHLHTQLARRALGGDVADAWPPLAAVLRPRRQPRAWWHAAELAVADRFGLDHLGDRAEAGWAAARARARARGAAGDIALGLPGGRLARDAGPDPAPAYALVNLFDLAAASANGAPPVVRQALDRGLRWAAATGQFAAARRRRERLAPLVPALLNAAGRRRWAEREADAVRAAGGAPLPGWPGYEDAPWPALAPGTP
jgi:hypothetical protein